MNDVQYLADLRSWDRGEWIMFPRYFMFHMKPREAVFLADLVNIANMRITSGQDEDFWFVATTKQLQGNMGWSTDMVDRILRVLVKQGWIRTKTKGKFARQRWIYIQVESLREIRLEHVQARLERSSSKAAELRSPSPQNCGNGTQQNCGLSLSIKRTVKKKEHCPDCVEADWEDMANRLKNAVNKVRTLNSTSRPSTWPSSFKLLHTKDKITPSRIKAALRWYGKRLKKGGDLITNGNPEFIPIAYSGPVFRSKFDAIEGAMSRHQQKIKPKGKIKVSRVFLHELSKEDQEAAKNDPNRCDSEW